MKAIDAMNDLIADMHDAGQHDLAGQLEDVRDQLASIVSVRDAGRRGGLATVAKHGSDHFTAIGIAGGAATRAKHGREFYAAIGSIGGRAPKSTKPKPPRPRRKGAGPIERELDAE